jgi:predicted DsbA family dithiol-disulfide isomerase
MADARLPDGTAVTIDIISDVVCPWCYIGKRRLERALAELPQIRPLIHWRPFQLDPTIPLAGLDRTEYLRNKFGSLERVQAIQQRLIDSGLGEGVAFQFERISRSPNTLDAHRLIRWAYGAGVQNAVVERLFELYFIAGSDIGDRGLLCAVAQENGMQGAVVAKLLDDGADQAAVSAEIAAAQQLGVTGVPTFIFAGRLAVSGAQSVSALASAARHAAASAEPANPD